MTYAICPECGEITRELKCKYHPKAKLLISKGRENESFIGEEIYNYLYGRDHV